MELLEFFAYSGFKSLYQIYVICRYFRPTFGLSLYLLMVFFDAQKILILMNFNVSNFVLSLPFGVKSDHPLPNPRLQQFILVLLPKSFIV